MKNIEDRIACLEQKVMEPSPSQLVQLLELWPHGEAWYDDLSAAVNDPDSADALTSWALSSLEGCGGVFSIQTLPVAIDRGLAELLFIETRAHQDPFGLEQWRGQVPDHVIAAVYNNMRNYAYPSDVTLLIRKLAGVVDENGDPMPGYILRDNGLINDSP